MGPSLAFIPLRGTNDCAQDDRPSGTKIAELRSAWTGRVGDPSPHSLGWLLVFFVALLAVADCHACAQGHEGHWRQQQYQHASADGVLTIFGCGLGGAVAHGTALAEGRHGPEQQK